MSVKNVMTLFKVIDERDDVRRSLNKCTNRREFINKLDQYQLCFSFEEFDDAVNYMHTLCQTQEAANELFAKANWFRFLLSSLSNK